MNDRNGWGADRLRSRSVERAVDAILRAVELRGDAALRDLTRRFDGVARGSLELSAGERRSGARAAPPETRRVLRLAARRIAAFARRQKLSLRPFRMRQDDLVLEQRLLPIERVGVYVPGGLHPLATSLLMGAVPARLAGCRSVVVCTPPGPSGAVPPAILAAAEIARVDRIFAVGGAQAIAALAFGTESVPRVDLIVGPGNAYVAAAKARLAGRVGIDLIAGPTELMVIADRSSDAPRVAADLLAQAEHDRDARLWLVMVGRAPGAAIRRELRRGADRLPPENRATARASIGRMRLLRPATTESAAAIANLVAPEHLSLQIAAPRRIVPRLRQYGSLFIGPGSAVAFGDYVAGPNHILPTGGAARHVGGLSVLRFLRPVTVQEAGPRALARLAPAAERLAVLEGLRAHADSLALRSGRRRPAVLFDFDGVLVDSEPAHYRAFREVLAPLGLHLSRALYDARYLAFDDRTALEAMLDDAGLRRAGRRGAPGDRPSVPALLRRKRTLFRERLARRIDVPRRTVRLLKSLHGRTRLAIVSGAARVEILAALRRAGIGELFPVIVSAESVTRCKPDPQGYRAALRRLGLGQAGDCLAVEDSPGGIRAARSAGLEVLGIATSYPPGALRAAGAARIAPRLEATGVRDLLWVRDDGARAVERSRSRSAGRSRGRGRSRKPPG